MDTNFSDSSGNSFLVNGIHALPWHGSVSVGFNRSSFSGDFGTVQTVSTGTTAYTTDSENVNVSFHPTVKLWAVRQSIVYG